MLEDVHYLELVKALELLFTDSLEVVRRDPRAGTGTSDKKCQNVFGQQSSDPTPGRINNCQVQTPGPKRPSGCTTIEYHSRDELQEIRSQGSRCCRCNYNRVTMVMGRAGQ
jgi:hypothetical protein